MFLIFSVFDVFLPEVNVTQWHSVIPFIEEGIDDLASNGVEGQIVDALQVSSSEIQEVQVHKKSSGQQFPVFRAWV